MEFLHTFYLYFLPLISLPILIHFFYKRKKKSILVGSIHFIRLAYKERSKGLKLRNIILLIIRTALLFLFILFFASPVIKTGTSGISSTSNNSVIIILDNSFSMGYKGEMGQYLDIAKERAVDLVKLLKPGDNIALITADDIADNIIPFLSYDTVSISKRIDSIGLFSGRFNLSKALKRASSLLAEASNPVKTAIVISDFQANNIKENTLSFPYNLIAVKTGDKEKGNVFIKKIKIPEKLFGPDSNIRLGLSLKNSGTRTEQIILKIFLNGEKRFHSDYKIEAGKELNTGFYFEPGKKEYIFGKIEIHNDHLEFDNTKYFIIHVKPKIRINIIDDTFGKEPAAADSFFLVNAIDPLYFSLRNDSSFLRLKISPSSSFDKNNDIYFILGVKNLSFFDLMAKVSEKKKIKAVFFLPPGLNFGRYKGDFYHGIFKSHIEKYNLPVIESIKLHSFNKTHPIFLVFNNLFKKKSIKEFYSLSTDNYSGLSLALLDTGDPFIIEEKHDNFHLLIFPFIPEPRRVDIVFDADFPIMIHQIIKYLTETSILLPDKTANIYADKKYSFSKRSFIAYAKEVKQAGIYFNKNEFFSVNSDQEESLILSLDNSKIKKIFNSEHLSLFSASDNFIQQINQDFSRSLLSPFILFFFILFLILENIVSNELIEYIIDWFKKIAFNIRRVF